MINVSWDDAQRYTAWLSHKLGLRGKEVIRLPTEAEWEFAARGGADTAYWWGGGFRQDRAVCRQVVQHTKTLPVGGNLQREDPRGLHDMLGNVMEWVEDAYLPYG